MFDKELEHTAASSCFVPPRKRKWTDLLGGVGAITVRSRYSQQPLADRHMAYFYGTVPALAWVINHYFYSGVHYAWLAAAFNPLRTNPDSSNPYVIYGQFYAAWAWDDPNDKMLLQMRVALAHGVEVKDQEGALSPGTFDTLVTVCDRAPVRLFYPVVYRVDIDRIARDRRLVKGSALSGSRECLVTDLRESEFDLLFADNPEDTVFRKLVLDANTAKGRTSRHDALELLRRSAGA